MSLFNKLVTLTRGGARETAQALIDANGLRILAQEVCDYEQSLIVSRRELTQLVAERLRTEREAAQQREQIALREQQLAVALSRDQPQEVTLLAGWIAEQEPLLQRTEARVAALRNDEQRLTQQQRLAAQELQEYQRQLRWLQAQRSGQRAAVGAGRAQGRNADLRGELQASLQRVRALQEDDRRLNEAERALDEALQADALTGYDRVQQQQCREQARAAVIARVRLAQGPVRPA